MKLHIIIASTRKERVGGAVAEWFNERATAHGKFATQLVDLREQNLPLVDEPHHPRMKKYQHEHTKKWSALVSEADAFAWVVPEYNYSMPPAMLNAIDYLFSEWHYKPCCLVSYGGISAGTRSAQMCRGVLATMKSPPMAEAVSIPMVHQHMENGKFKSNDGLDKSVMPMLDELFRWTDALKVLRA